MATAIREEDSRKLSARETVLAIRNGNVSAVQCTQAALALAAEHATLNAFITLDHQGANATARAADANADKSGALFGVPVVVKDNIATAGLPTSAGTPALKDWVPETDAPVWQRLRDAGAILIGKTNMHELAFGITSNNSAFGAVGNSRVPGCFAGGSSGGTGAAIGIGVVAAGLGTDTGGSVRIPAALNGVAGLRPTKGRYSGAGIVPLSATLDTPGPMAATVDDLVLLDGVVTGMPTDLDPVPLSGVRLGVPAPFTTGLDDETLEIFDAAIAALRQAGATLVPIEMDGLMQLSGKVGFALALWEFKRDLAAFLADNRVGLSIDDVASQVASPDVKFIVNELILGPQAMTAAAYDAAITIFRPQLQGLYAETFSANHLDAVVFPTTPLPAQPITGCDSTVTLGGKEAATFDTFIRNTAPGANAGIPGLAIPAGLTRDGRPVGIELDGPAFSDRRLLAIGLSVERVLASSARTAP